MAVITGISGIQIGDGAGGNIALTITTRVLKILSSMNLSYLSATIKNPNDVKNGSVTFYRPELIQVGDYGTTPTTGTFDAAQVPSFQVNLSTRRVGRWTYEEFDLSRMGGVESVMGMIANGLALSVQADLNAHFLDYVTTQLKTTLKAQNLVLPNLAPADPAAMTPEISRQAMNALKYKVGQLSKMYDKAKLGVPYSEIITLLSVESDIVIENAFWGQQGSIEIILNGLTTKKFGNVNYLVENMLLQNIAAASSFSKDKALDTSNFCGLILHNEAIAFPMNFMTGKFITNQNSGNPQFIMKYQFGLGIIRPELVWGIVKTAIPANSGTPATK